MAGVAVAGDGAAVGADVVAVVAAEAARKIHVAEVVGIRSPFHAHLGKDVAVVDGYYRSGGAFHGRPITRLIGTLDRGGDAGSGLGLRPILLAQCLDRDLFDERKRRRDGAAGERQVHGALGQLKAVGGAVVAVHAVHQAAREVLERLGLDVGGGVNGGAAGRAVVVFDLRNGLAALVGGAIVDRHSGGQMRHVNAGMLTRAADAHQQDGLGEGVLLVVGVLGDDLEAILGELLRPMAGLAGFARGAQVAHGRGNGPRVVVQDDGENLAQAGELALNEPGGAGADVAGHAVHPRVGRALVSRVFGLHHGVAGLAAKGDSIHVGDGAVAELAADDDVDQRGDAYEPGQTAQLGRAQSKRVVSERIAAQLALHANVQPDAQRDQSQSQEEDPRQDHVRQNPDVRMLDLAAQAGGQQEEPQDGGGGHGDHTDPADPVLAQVDDRVDPRT